MYNHAAKLRQTVRGSRTFLCSVLLVFLTGSGAYSQTVIKVEKSQSTITSLNFQHPFDAQLWDITVREGMGVIGSDYRGSEAIGSAAFERDSNNAIIPDRLNIWFPQNPRKPRNDHRSDLFKRTLSGIVDAEDKPFVVDIEGTFEDFDFSVHIKPAPKYMNLITRAHTPKFGVLQAVKALKEEHDLDNPCTEPFKTLEAEIDVASRGKEKLKSLVLQRVGKQISVYGPWVFDRGHCHQPEIHPAEQIWWSENIAGGKQYNLNLFCDSSERFWWRDQMDDGTKLKPWGAPPIRGIFAIAFEVQLGVLTGGKKFEATTIDSSNVASFPEVSQFHNLVFQNITLVSFVSHSHALKVSYEKVGLKRGTTNVIRGFLVLEATVGTVKQIATTAKFQGATNPIRIPPGTDPNRIHQALERQVFKKDAGHFMLSVLQTDTRPE
jgi:hypothetical protein